MRVTLRAVDPKLVVLITTAGVDMLGTLMVLPLLPFYATRMGANAFTYTCLVSSFSVATLISSPIWGRFSDRYGRRPALLIALSAPAIAYIIFAFADSLFMLLLSRVVQGAGGGTVGVVQAYVADASAPVPLGAAVVPATRTQVAAQYLKLGYTHILPKGTDHILFVLGIFLLSRKLKPILQPVTAFTIPHTLTLALSIYGLVRLHPSGVPPLIALSILFVAVENLLTPDLTPPRA